MASIKGGYDRRWSDWKLQERLANKELAGPRLDGRRRCPRARWHGTSWRTTICSEQSREVDCHMRRSTRTGRSLRLDDFAGVGSTSGVSSRLRPRRAERAYRFELGLADSSFVQFGYWDSLKKGLLAGEGLQHDLRRMEVAFSIRTSANEITKALSLASWDPMALLMLKEHGECFFTVTEAMLDTDYPGHFMRRIRSVGLSIPCVAGPYTSVNCTLTMLKSSIRKSNLLSAGEHPVEYARQEEDTRFADAIGAVQSITCDGRNEGGVFELNLRDERYLPFEGAGAISEWRLTLPPELRQFDYRTISDVILHLRYTAREGGEALRKADIGCRKRWPIWTRRHW